MTVGIINRIAITKRLSEFGLLHALGRQKVQLIRRLTLETAAVAGLGCLVGLVIALLVLSLAQERLFLRPGHGTGSAQPGAILFRPADPPDRRRADLFERQANLYPVGRRGHRRTGRTERRAKETPGGERLIGQAVIFTHLLPAPPAARDA